MLGVHSPLNYGVCLLWVRLDQCFLKVFWLVGLVVCVLVDGPGSCLSEMQCHVQ